MALCLNQLPLVRAAWERVPLEQIALVARQIPLSYLERFLAFLAAEMDESRHVHALLLWAQHVLLLHSAHLRDNLSTHEVSLRALHKGTRRQYDELGRVCNTNLFSLSFIADQIADLTGEGQSALKF